MSAASLWHLPSRSARLSRQASPLSAPQSPSVPSTPGRRRNFRTRSRLGRGSRLSSSPGRVLSPSTPGIPCGEPRATLPDAGRARRAPRDGPRPRHRTTRWGSRGHGRPAPRVSRSDALSWPRYRPAVRHRAGLGVHFDGNSWSVRLPDGTDRRGALVSPPRIFGLVTELDLASKPALAVTVQPYPQDTHPSTRQTLLRLFAAALLRPRSPSPSALAVEVAARSRFASGDCPRRTASLSESPRSGGCSPLCRSTTAGSGDGR